MDLTSYQSLLFPLVKCQEPGQSFPVATDRPPSADELLESLRSVAKLAALDVYEELAELSEQSPIALIRTRFRATYQKAIGVPPEERHAFRVALEGVRDGGGQSVANLIDIFRRRHQAKGSFSTGDEPGWPSAPTSRP